MCKFTIITVCLNAVDSIRTTIESVINQTYTDFEYLIIDGASTDGTIDIVKEYINDQRVRFYSEPDTGIYNAMNKGIARAKGNYVNFLNAGDYFYNKDVLKQVYMYVNNNSNSIFYGNQILNMPDGSRAFFDFDSLKGAFIDKALRGEMPLHQTIFSPRTYLANHYFKESFLICGDYEWFIYCISKNVSFVKIPLTICYFDKSGISSRAESNKILEKEVMQVISEYSACIQNGRISHEIERDANISIYKERASRNGLLFQLMYQWLSLKQKGISLDYYCECKHYKRIAIYGMSHVGQRVIDELKNTAIDVVYGIDQNAENIVCTVPVKNPYEELDNVDAIIVTAITFFDEIKENLKGKINCQIISLESIVLELLKETNIRESE